MSIMHIYAKFLVYLLYLLSIIAVKWLYALTSNIRAVFGGLPEPNRSCLVGVYAFLICNNLCDLVYQTPTKSYQSQIPVAFGIPGHVTTKHLPDTPC